MTFPSPGVNMALWWLQCQRKMWKIYKEAKLKTRCVVSLWTLYMSKPYIKNFVISTVQYFRLVIKILPNLGEPKMAGFLLGTLLIHLNWSWSIIYTSVNLPTAAFFFLNWFWIPEGFIVTVVEVQEPSGI